MTYYKAEFKLKATALNIDPKDLSGFSTLQFLYSTILNLAELVEFNGFIS